MNEGKILVFARAPVPGKAKTRLIPALGLEGAAKLHAQLVIQTLNTVCGLHEHPVELWCTPDTNHDFFQSCTKEFNIKLHLQQGEDLGARMHHAFSSALHSHSWAILLGTDCPNLSTGDLIQAISTMQSGAEAVVGPAFDGGYYLLGLREPAATLFEDMPWGTSEVLDLTLQRLHNLGRKSESIPWQQDLDRPEDLKYFHSLPEWIRQRNGHCAATDSTAPGSTDSTAPT